MLFNAIYTLAGCRTEQPIQADSIITIAPDDRDATTKWAKWFFSLPVKFAHGAYNCVAMAMYKDTNEVIARQIYSGNSINAIQFIGKSGHILSSPKAISVLRPYFRDDPEGPFEVEKDEAFFSVLKDLYPNEIIKREDFLFTCSHANVENYRQPLLDYIGPQALPLLRPQINQTAQDTLDELENLEGISARNLAETYTVAIMARLFLNHPGTFRDFENIGKAASFVLDYQYNKKWGAQDANQVIIYENALQTLRSAIDQSNGEFIENLEDSGLSPIRIKGELLLIYVVGSETTSSSMEYVLWRLGQDADLQNEIRNNPALHLERFINECFKHYTSLPYFSRFASKDIVIKVQNRDGEIWEYPIAKGEALIAAPHLAGRFKFGIGEHSCPGQWLAKAELRSMILTLLKRFEVESFPIKNELSTKLGHSFLKLEPVTLNLRRRHQPEEES